MMRVEVKPELFRWACERAGFDTAEVAERAAKQAEAGDAAGLRETEREIDEIVYRLFDLTSDEIALIEKSLAGVRAPNDDADEEEGGD